jgi:hypothetical protein
MWGTMVKRPAGQVTADVHLWTRGKGDVDVAEAYSDNLKEASDESLRAVAARLFARLTGGVVSGGILMVHAGSGKGTVLVDGVERGTLDGGVARLDVSAGSHTITVKVPGYESQSQTATVGSGELDMNFTLTQSGAPPPEAPPGPSARKVGEWAAIGVGGALLAAGVVMGVKWIIDYNHGKDLQQKVASTTQDACQRLGNANEKDLCDTSHTVTTDYTLGWILGGLGAAVLGTGVVLLMTDESTKDESPAAGRAPQAKPRLDVIPQVGATGASMGLRLTF